MHAAILNYNEFPLCGYDTVARSMLKSLVSLKEYAYVFRVRDKIVLVASCGNSKIESVANAICMNVIRSSSHAIEVSS